MPGVPAWYEYCSSLVKEAIGFVNVITSGSGYSGHNESASNSFLWKESPEECGKSTSTSVNSTKHTNIVDMFCYL